MFTKVITFKRHQEPTNHQGNLVVLAGFYIGGGLEIELIKLKDPQNVISPTSTSSHKHIACGILNN